MEQYEQTQKKDDGKIKCSKCNKPAIIVEKKIYYCPKCYLKLKGIK